MTSRPVGQEGRCSLVVRIFYARVSQTRVRDDRTGGS